MKILGYIALLLSTILVGCETTYNHLSEKQDDSLNFADSLLSLLSLEEKVGQMTNLSLMALAKGEFWDRRDTVILDPDKLTLYLDSFKVGSIQNLGTYPFGPTEWRQNIEIVQDFVQKNTEHKIPILYGIDAVHGANYTAGSTLFPHQIGLAASRNRELVSEVARITSYEMRASGIPWNYAPVLDVSKKPLWGRTFETFGEDTYISSELGLAMLKGGGVDSLLSPYSSLACLKHFLAYGAPHNGKDRAAVYLPERTLIQDYLPPFTKAIENGALTIMISSNSVNGIPSHADKNLLTDLLKVELGFKGFLISDWNDIDNLVKTHQVASNEREAVKLAVNAGLDMCMEPYDASFASHVIELVQNGEIPMKRIDDAVRRILFVKHKLGLFQQLQSDPELYPEFGSKKFADISKNAAIEAITLLKNKNDALPLDRGDKVLLTGAGSHSLNFLNGAWSRTWSGQDTTFNDTDKLTIRDAIEQKIDASNLIWSQGTSYDKEININETKKAAKNASKIVVVLAELPATEKPSDIDALDFPEAQIALVEKLAETGKSITLVLLEGRPRLIRELEPQVDAIILAYLPGNEGGSAIADILFGDANPSGKLPFTYPKSSGSIWSYDYVKADARDKGFGFEGYDPQYEFGHGLSYSKFEYTNLLTSADTIKLDDSLEVKINVTNKSNLVGKEVVELYVSDLFASVVPKNKVLRGFEKIEIQPSETVEVNFILAKEDFQFIDSSNQPKVEKGEFILTIDSFKTTLYLEP